MRSTDYPKPQHFIYKPHHQGLAVTFFCGLMVGIAVSTAAIYVLWVWSLRP